MNQISNERQGKPSGSNGPSYEKCSGKFKLEQGLPNETSSAAAEGNRIHEWCSDPDSIKLEGEELDLAKECLSQREMLLGMVFNDYIDNPPQYIIEKRLWYHRNRFSGKPDFIALRDGRALLVDYKCGRIPVERAERNVQLKWYVALVAHVYNIKEIVVAIVQPRCSASTLHSLDKKGITACRNRVTRTLRRMEAPNPTLNPGPVQCKYCKAKAICPALQKKQESLATIKDAQAITPMQMSGILDFLPIIEDRCKAIKEHAKRMLNDGANIQGWQLTPASPRRSINDPEAAMTRLDSAGLIDPNDFLGACRVSVGKLQRAVGESMSVGPGDARRLVNNALGEVIEEKQGEPKMERIKE